MQIPKEQVIFTSIRTELGNEARIHTFIYGKIQEIYRLSVLKENKEYLVKRSSCDKTAY